MNGEFVNCLTAQRLMPGIFTEASQGNLSLIVLTKDTIQ